MIREREKERDGDLRDGDGMEQDEECIRVFRMR